MESPHNYKPSCGWFPVFRHPQNRFIPTFSTEHQVLQESREVLILEVRGQVGAPYRSSSGGVLGFGPSKVPGGAAKLADIAKVMGCMGWGSGEK